MPDDDAELTEWSCWTEHCPGEVVGKYRVTDVADAPFDAWLCLKHSAGREWVEGTPLPDRPSETTMTDSGFIVSAVRPTAAPGRIAIHRSGSVARLERRKEDDSGWLISGGGGLADTALTEDGWVLPTDIELSQLFDAIQEAGR